jgi:hypothetical protein
LGAAGPAPPELPLMGMTRTIVVAEATARLWRSPGARIGAGIRAS